MIETYKKIFEESNSDRRDSEQWEKAFKFMSEDDGKDFYMVNFLDRNESPRTMEATGEGATSLDFRCTIWNICGHNSLKEPHIQYFLLMF